MERYKFGKYVDASLALLIAYRLTQACQVRRAAVLVPLSIPLVYPLC